MSDTPQDDYTDEPPWFYDPVSEAEALDTVAAGDPSDPRGDETPH